LLLGVAGIAAAQGVGPDGPFETTHILEGGSTIDPSPAVRIASVGQTTAPIPVELDPAGPQWIKHLEETQGISPGSGIAMIERLLVSGQRQWTGWREEIVTPGFTWWQSGTLTRFDIYLGGPVPGLSIDYPPVGGAPGTGLEFSFADLPAGTQVSAHAILVYDGTTPFTGTVTLRSSPTPEPGSCILVVLGGALLLGRGHRSANSCFHLRGGQLTAAMTPFDREESM
jgi:hypothetical protein